MERKLRRRSSRLSLGPLQESSTVATALGSAWETTGTTLGTAWVPTETTGTTLGTAWLPSPTQPPAKRKKRRDSMIIIARDLPCISPQLDHDETETPSNSSSSSRSVSPCPSSNASLSSSNEVLVESFNQLSCDSFTDSRIAECNSNNANNTPNTNDNCGPAGSNRDSSLTTLTCINADIKPSDSLLDSDNSLCTPKELSDSKLLDDSADSFYNTPVRPADSKFDVPLSIRLSNSRVNNRRDRSVLQSDSKCNIPVDTFTISDNHTESCNHPSPETIESVNKISIYRDIVSITDTENISQQACNSSRPMFHCNSNSPSTTVQKREGYKTPDETEDKENSLPDTTLTDLDATTDSTLYYTPEREMGRLLLVDPTPCSPSFSKIFATKKDTSFSPELGSPLQILAGGRINITKSQTAVDNRAHVNTDSICLGGALDDKSLVSYSSCENQTLGESQGDMSSIDIIKSNLFGNLHEIASDNESEIDAEIVSLESIDVTTCSNSTKKIDLSDVVDIMGKFSCHSDLDAEEKIVKTKKNKKSVASSKCNARNKTASDDVADVTRCSDPDTRLSLKSKSNKRDVKIEIPDTSSENCEGTTSRRTSGRKRRSTDFYLTQALQMQESRLKKEKNTSLIAITDEEIKSLYSDRNYKYVKPNGVAYETIPEDSTKPIKRKLRRVINFDNQKNKSTLRSKKAAKLGWTAKRRRSISIPKHEFEKIIQRLDEEIAIEMRESERLEAESMMQLQNVDNQCDSLVKLVTHGLDDDVIGDSFGFSPVITNEQFALTTPKSNRLEYVQSMDEISDSFGFSPTISTDDSAVFDQSNDELGPATVT